MPSQSFWNVARHAPDRLAVVDPDGNRMTFGELRDLANQIVHALRGRGMRRGDGLAILMPNSIEFLAVVLAAQQAGFYFTPMNYHFRRAELAHVLSNAEIKVLFTHERFAETAARAVEEAGLPDLYPVAVGDVPDFGSFADLVMSASNTEPEDRETGSLMSYTSGTTGLPKGVRRPLMGLSPEDADAVMMDYNMLTVFGMQADHDNVHLCVSPLYHNSPISFSLFALQLGHTVILMDKFTPKAMLGLVATYAGTSTHMVPVQFVRMLALSQDERSKYDTSSLQVIAHAGAPCPAEVKRQMIEWLGPVVYEYYSASEGVGGTMVTPQDALERPGTVGRPFRAGTEIHILDEDGVELPAGEVGLVYSTLPGDGFTYYKDDAKSSAARQGNLFTVGDYGLLDEQGYLFLKSRRTDLILSGGVNIYPAEIEAVLVEHPLVSDAAVFGIPDDEWGEQIKAVVELLPGGAPGEAETADILAFCASRLAGFKVPKTVDFTDEFPRDPNGKMFKRRLRDPYWANHEQS